MTYATKKDSVTWKGKRLPGVDASDFLVLSDDRFARAAGAIWMRGKALSVDASSFELLSSTFAKDKDGVFEILASKLKPVPKADPRNFRAIGQAHGEDAATGWWRGKAIRGSQVPGLVELDPHHARDGKRIFHGKSKLSFKPKLPLHHDRIRLIPARETNAINLCELVLLDGERAVYADPRYSNHDIGWHRFDSSAVASLRFLEGGERTWVTDGSRLFWRGRTVTDLEERTPEVLSDAVVRIGGSVFVGPAPAPKRIDADSLVHVAHEHFADRTGLWELAARPCRKGGPDLVIAQLLAERAPLEGPLIAYPEVFLRHVTDLVFRLREHLSYEDHWRDRFGEEDPPPSRHDLAQLEIRWDGETVTLAHSDQSATGTISGWYRLAGELWAALEGSEVLYQPYPHAHYMESAGLHVQERILGGTELLAMQAAEALDQLGARQAAYGLAIQVGVRAGGGAGDRALELGSDVAGWAAISAHLLAHRSYPHRSHEIAARTYLAGAKRILESGLLASEDDRTRYELMALAHGLVCSTQKDAKFLQEIVPALRERVELEPIGFIRDLALGAIDLACRPSVFDADWLEHAREHLKFLIEQGVNVEVNRLRLAGDL